jgi:hypothetical protein
MTTLAQLITAAILALVSFSPASAAPAQDQAEETQSQAAATRTQGDVIYNGPIVNVNGPAAPAAGAPQANWPNLPPAVQNAPAATPTPEENDPHERGFILGGPRFGFSYADGGGFDKLAEAVHKAKPDAEVEPFMTQFGWQMEYRLFKTDKGLTALTEFIPLVGGLDQGLALPSATWLVGLRGKHGFEVGVGPQASLGGASMMLGLGYTLDMGGINIPVNLAVGRGAYQTTGIAFSTGFNL